MNYNAAVWGDIMIGLGRTIRSLRIQHRLTQAQLAQKLNVTKSVISAYENDLRMPSYDVLIAMTKIFKVSSDYMLGLENKREVDLSGLTEEEITALMNLIKAMKRK